MPNKNIADQVEGFIRPLMDNDFPGIELYDLEFIKEGPNWYLRIYIDKEGGVTIDDCEAVSRAVEKVLDEKDPIEHAYILEVSSPGIDRALKKEADFAKYAGQDVEIRLYKPTNGVKIFQGKLKGLIDGDIVIADGEAEARFKKEDVAVCKLAII